MREEKKDKDVRLEGGWRRRQRWNKILTGPQCNVMPPIKRFHLQSRVTNGRIDGRTNPLIQMPGRIKRIRIEIIKKERKEDFRGKEKKSIEKKNWRKKFVEKIRLRVVLN